MLYDDTTPIAALTVADLRQLIRETSAASAANSPRTSGHYVYGLRGIQQLFGVSHKTAQEYKDGLIKDAVRQNGRKIIVDADYAVELFGRRKDNAGK
jgi:hypothetical protein